MSSPTPNSDPDVRTVPHDADARKGFPRAVAARIGDRPLWLGDSGAAESEYLDAMNLTPDYVVSVCRNAASATTDHIPLVDGRVNDPQQFRRAVDTVRDRYDESNTVLVNCAAGISRSSTVIATALAVEDQLSFPQAVTEIAKSRECAAPHPKLQINAQSYLAAVHGRSDARSALADLVDDVYIGGEDAEAALAPLQQVQAGERHLEETNE